MTRLQPIRVALRVLGTVAGLYLVAAVVGGLLPVNRDFVPDPDGVTIYLRSNGVHAEIAVPYANRVADWRPEFPVADIVPSFIAFGWGHGAFYMGTRTWRDVRPLNAIMALLGIGDSVMHVELVGGPVRSAGDVAVSISEPQYQRLVAYLRAHLVRDDELRPIVIEGAGFGRGDRFYEASGRYSPVLTCNEWVRRALAASGIRAPLWAPLDLPLLLHLRWLTSG